MPKFYVAFTAATILAGSAAVANAAVSIYSGLDPSGTSKIQSFGTVEINTGSSKTTHDTEISALPTVVTDQIGSAPNTDSATYTLRRNGFNITTLQSRNSSFQPDSNGNICFQASNATTSYNISASYTFPVPEADLNVQLKDLTTRTTIFYFDEDSDDSAGTLTPDSGNSDGPLTGLLIPGHIYVASYEFSFFDPIDPEFQNTSGTATGSVAFNFTDSSVPEPSGLALLILGGACLARRR